MGCTELGEHWRHVRGVGALRKLDLACVVRRSGSGGGLYNNDAHIDDVAYKLAWMLLKLCKKRAAVPRIPCSVERALTLFWSTQITE